MPEHGDITMFEYWRPLLTEYFITEIKKQGNLLINLASAEMKEGRSSGMDASNIMGASKTMSTHMIIKWTNAERNIAASPKYNGMRFALYTFMISVP